MQDIFALRFQVYCEEKGYLPKSDFPDRLESDAYDADAIHFAVYGDHETPVGYMRLILGSAAEKLPFEVHGVEMGVDYRVPARSLIAEPSRIMVRADYRKTRRAMEDGFSSPGLMPSKRLRSAADLIQLKFFRLAYRYCVDNGIEYLLGAVPPANIRKTNAMGLPWRPVGRPTDYFGTVVGCEMSIKALEASLASKCPEVWEMFRDPTHDAHCRTFLPGQWAAVRTNHVEQVTQ